MNPIIDEDGRPDSIFSERRCRENRLRGRNEPPPKTNKKGSNAGKAPSSPEKGRGLDEPGSGSGPAFRPLSGPRKARETGFIQNDTFSLKPSDV